MSSAPRYRLQRLQIRAPGVSLSMSLACVRHGRDAIEVTDPPKRDLSIRERMIIEKMLDQCATYADYPDERAELAEVIERIGLNMTQAYLHDVTET